METVAEAHIARTPPTAGGIVMPITHTVQDSLRATVEVKKVGAVLLHLLLQTKMSNLVQLCDGLLSCPLRDKLSKVTLSCSDALLK